MRKLILVLLVAGAMVLSGCAATGVALSKRNLDVQTKMTDSIFLDPPMPGHQKVLVHIRNTSDKPDFTIQSEIEQALRQRGWTITRNPEEADYMLQANILQVGKTDKTAAEQIFASGYGGALGTGVLGAASYYAVNPDYGRGGLIAGLVAAGGEFVAGQLVKDVYYTAITDVQISKRVNGKVKMTGEQDLAQGNSGSEKLEYSEETNWKRYRTRILSTANQVNLDWEDAAPKLREGLANSIAGLF